MLNFCERERDHNERQPRSGGRAKREEERSDKGVQKTGMTAIVVTSYFFDAITAPCNKHATSPF